MSRTGITIIYRSVRRVMSAVDIAAEAPNSEAARLLNHIGHAARKVEGRLGPLDPQSLELWARSEDELVDILIVKYGK